LSENLKKLAIIAIIVIAVTITPIVYLQLTILSYEKTLIIFHAGSLTGYVEDLSEIMEKNYPGLEVLNEPSGSVDVIRKVIDLKKPVDIMMVADYRLIPDLMFSSGKAKWVLVFAANEIVIAFTDKSKYANEINTENWLEILMRPDVRFGFSDPNKDPCGYRAILVLGLASLYYKTQEPLEVLKESADVKYSTDQGKIIFDVSEGIFPDSVRIFTRDKSVDLIALLEAGIIDYAFEYKNVAVSKGLKFVKLPKEINLGDPSYSDWYSKVSIKILAAGNVVKTIEGAFTSYGLTIPVEPQHPTIARKFVELLLSDGGRSTLEKNGFKSLSKPIILGSAPDWLKELVK